MRNPRYEVATGMNPGQRDYQEDALIADFPQGVDFGFAVLADGMGGHAAGDIASKIIVTEVFSELKFQCGDPGVFGGELPQILWDAARSANDCIRAHVAHNPQDRGMGSTLVAPIFVEDRLFWISIGDSPLYLLRDGEMQQLNEDHSMAPQIDLMCQSGMIDEDTARNHPDRNCLTSVLTGDEVPKVDCPREGLPLLSGDIILASSDGLQFLSNEEIEEILVEYIDCPAAEITGRLLRAVTRLDDPDQDNLSFCLIKVNWTEAEEQAATADDVETAHLGVVNG